jgi:N-acetylglucosaminyldiphosphoundecaprenol N-acetyl-beta-D-mannosaminyltransferase
VLTEPPPAPTGPQRARWDRALFGLPLDHLAVPDLVTEVSAAVAHGRRIRVLNVNAHCVNLTRGCERLREALLAAEIVHGDGSGVRLAARILGVPPPPRTSYSDLLPALLAEAEAKGWRLFLLGGRPGVAAAAAQRLHERHPRLRVAGHHHGFFDKDPAGAESGAVVDAVRAAEADVLLVGFGMPAQELWLHDHWSRLGVPVGLAGGAAIDRLAGAVPDAPGWMARLGLEWLFRLVREPRRLARRYLLGLPRFLAAAVALRARSWTRPGGDDRVSVASQGGAQG